MRALYAVQNVRIVVELHYMNSSFTRTLLEALADVLIGGVGRPSCIVEVAAVVVAVCSGTSLEPAIAMVCSIVHKVQCISHNPILRLYTSCAYLHASLCQHKGAHTFNSKH
jgi:hypothetical protein